MIRIRSLTKQYGSNAVLRGIDLDVAPGEFLVVLGPSGAGKSTLLRCINGLATPTSGELVAAGFDATDARNGNIRKLRQQVAMIFQHHNVVPRLSVLKNVLTGRLGQTATLSSVLQLFSRQDVALAMDCLRRVELEHKAGQRTDALSGGQRQRVGIARAIITRPKLVVADEAVSALDVSIQAQILNLLQELQKEFALTYLFVSHDLAVIRHVSDSIGVMYLGRMVEYGSCESVYSAPKHPYTQALLSAIPREHPDQVRQRIVLQGGIPNPASPPAGCHFHPRCASCMEVCKTEAPPQVETAPGEYVACHLYR